MKRKIGFLSLFLMCGLGATVLPACQSVIPREIRDQADVGITFDSVFPDPAAHQGKMILWGGVILETRNEKDGTYIEVIEFPLGLNDRPQPNKKPGGRFLILHPGFLDPVVYGRGREITVIGEIIGKRTKAIEETEYTYPVVKEREVVFWKPRPRVQRFHFGIGGAFVR